MIEISEVANKLGIESQNITRYGKWMAKINYHFVMEELKEQKKGKLVLITAITPTPAGEGKTVTSIGLSMGLNFLGHKAVVCLRQPSLGPVFGVKGGAAGGGRSTVEPTQEINLRFTGDIDAIAAAHNLLAAMVDNHIFHGNKLGIDVHSVRWRRTVDMNERSLRQVVVGLGSKSDGVPREDGYVITAASEVMATLCMARDYADLKKKLGNIIVGYTRDSKSVRASDLSAQGAMAALLKYAMEPNLVQTAEETPALIHGGPFGNIAMGTCSIISLLFALSHADYAVVEAGFATDLGAEKFFDVVSRVGGFAVDCVVIVASVRSLQYQGGGAGMKSSITGDPIACLSAGLDNLAKHIENARIFGLDPIVAINHFSTDTSQEMETIENFCKEQKVPWAISKAFEEGGKGCADLAKLAISACENGQAVNAPIYSFDESIQSKIEKIVKKIYGGEGVQYEPEALKDIARIEKLGLADLPICMAKTQLSISDDPTKLGRPKGFTPVVRRLDPAAGAGFIVASLGDIMQMPGLPEHPAAEAIDLDENGNITGLH